MAMPFVFRNIDHWNAVFSRDVLAPIENVLLKKTGLHDADYARASTSNPISNKVISNLGELEGSKMRVMGAPILARIFEAVTAAPAAIALSEVDNAVQTGVADGLESSAPSPLQCNFFEVVRSCAKHHAYPTLDHRLPPHFQ